MNYQVNNNIDGKGSQLINWRAEVLTQSQIEAIPVATTEDKAKQVGRKLYNSTTKKFMCFDEEAGAFVNEGSTGTLNYRGKLDISIATETATLKKNPPALANCKNGDIWIVAKSGIYTYIDADGNTKTQQAEIGDLFQVFVKIPGIPGSPDILDWMYVESATQQLELVFQYDEDNPDIISWEFVSYSDVAGSVLYDIWKLGYNVDMYKETTVEGPISGGDVVTRRPVFDKPVIMKDSDTYSNVTVYSIKVEFLHPLSEGEKYVIVLK